MVTGVVLAALTRVGACAQFVHGQGQSFVGLNAECAERHGAGHKVLHNGFHRLHLVDGGRSRCLLPAEKVTDEDGRFFLIYQRSPLLKFLVAAQAGGQLQIGNGFRIPGVFDAVLAPGELTVVGQYGVIGLNALPVQTDGIACDFFQSDAADGAHLCAEVAAKEVLAESDALKDFGAAIASDGRDAHLRHNLFQAFVHSLDVVRLGGGIVFLNLAALDKVVENGEGHIRTQRAGSVAQKQGGVHGLANFSALHNQRRLYALAHGDQIMMHGADGQ